MVELSLSGHQRELKNCSMAKPNGKHKRLENIAIIIPSAVVAKRENLVWPLELSRLWIDRGHG